MPIYDNGPDWSQPQERVVVREITWAQQLFQFLKWCLIIPIAMFILTMLAVVIGRMGDAIEAVFG